MLAWTEPGADPELDAIIVEQHIEGARLGAGVTVPRRQALLVGADIADAIAALHAARLMHGAIGSEAVVLDSAGRAIVGGAGAKMLQAAALGGAVADATPTDDLRQLGRLLYVLVCGRAPATPPTAPVELVPDIEPALNGLILSLLSDDELRPPPPAAAASLRLRDLAGEPVGEPQRAVVLARRPTQPRRPVVGSASDFALATGLAVLLLLGVAAAFALTHDDDEKAATTITVGTGTAAPSVTTDTLTLPGTVVHAGHLPDRADVRDDRHRDAAGRGHHRVLDAHRGGHAVPGQHGVHNRRDDRHLRGRHHRDAHGARHRGHPARLSQAAPRFAQRPPPAGAAVTVLVVLRLASCRW